MYGWLTFTKDNELVLSIPGWGLQYPPCSNDEVALRQREAAKFVEQQCANEKHREQIAAHLKYIVPHVHKNDLEFALYMCRAHYILPEALQQERLAFIDTIIKDLFDDLKSPSADQVRRVLSGMGILMPDAFQETILKELAAESRTQMLDEEEVVLPENCGHLHFIGTLGSMMVDSTANEATQNSQLVFLRQLVRVLLSRPVSERESLKKQMTEALNDKNKANVLLAYKQLMAPPNDLLPGTVSDALARIIKELPTSKDKPQEVIDRQVKYAVAEQVSQFSQTCRVTIAALTGKNKVKMGKTGTGSLAALASFDADEASMREIMARAAREKALAEQKKTQQQTPHNPTPQKPTPQKPTPQIPTPHKPTPQKPEIPEEESLGKEDIDPVWLWSVERLARWIEGPVIEQGQKKSIDRKKILEKEKVARERAPKIEGKKLSIAVVGEGEISGVIRNSLSAATRFFLGEIDDMLQLVQELKAEKLEIAFKDVRHELEALALKSGVDEEEVRAKLNAADAAIQALRRELTTVQTASLVETNFPMQLSIALSQEEMVLGKRHGRKIACPVTFDHWSYVVDNFHHRWVRGVKRIKLANQQFMCLDQDQAVALYVTGTSLSGYAFDVSVHLWRRRAETQSLPSDERGPFPRMNENDWYDTWAPCCVLHVPHLQK